MGVKINVLLYLRRKCFSCGDVKEKKNCPKRESIKKYYGDKVRDDLTNTGTYRLYSIVSVEIIDRL